MILISIAAAVVLACVSGTWADVVMDTVPVGNSGNTGELSGGGVYAPNRICGAVDYGYNIGKHEVTAGQYTEFLNAVAASDPYGLYNSSMTNPYGCQIQRNGLPGTYSYSIATDWANRPVNYVSWGDAARFANWMHNGQGSGDTEDGSYFLNGTTSIEALLAITREADATWAIPTEDEWYKAAYHKNDGVTGNYWGWPTGTDAVPSNDVLTPDPGNNANFWQGDYTVGSPYWTTEVGEFENSDSPYGTFDQGGNLWEWNETVVAYVWGEQHGMRGGSFGGNPSHVGFLHAMARAASLTDGFPSGEAGHLGFRVASIPEPATLSLLALSGLFVLRRRRVT
ncbi:MAG: SUMF1/EgtB/PvdO family nonheme iron enzyme [Phycisphaerae bacterium]|nr:SUMF1/EgtB/PvdO family nonheme iron enzyme [Phycisphaerae bacterium]